MNARSHPGSRLAGHLHAHGAELVGELEQYTDCFRLKIPSLDKAEELVIYTRNAPVRVI
jgi:hypothetical protein